MKHTRRHQDSELLKLLNGRKAWDQPHSRPPLLDLGAVHRAVSAHALAESSDPWAGPRMALYLRRGYELPSDVLREGNSRATLRAREPVKAPAQEALVGVKRRLDADKAWNQHKAKMWKDAA